MTVRSRMSVLSFDALSPLRREFLKRLNAIQKDLRAADATYNDLRRLQFNLGPPLHRCPLIREFVRTLFLSGNGSTVVWEFVCRMGRFRSSPAGPTPGDVLCLRHPAQIEAVQQRSAFRGSGTARIRRRINPTSPAL